MKFDWRDAVKNAVPELRAYNLLPDQSHWTEEANVAYAQHEIKSGEQGGAGRGVRLAFHGGGMARCCLACRWRCCRCCTPPTPHPQTPAHRVTLAADYLGSWLSWINSH